MRLLICAIACLLGGTTMASQSELDIHLLHELQRLETYDGHVAHAGYLWTAEGRIQTTDEYRVHVFDALSGDLVKTIALDHSAHYLYAFGSDSVIAVGKTTDPWLTHYTILRDDGNDIGIYKTHTFNMAFSAYRFGGDATHMFFNEPGSRGVYQFRNRSLSRVGDDVSQPAMMKWDVDANVLWIVEGGALGFGDENLVALDPSTGSTKRVFNSGRAGITDIELFADLGWIVANEAMADRVLVIDTDDRTVKHTIEVSGSPRGMARYGRCVAITSSDSKEVNFIDLTEATPSIIATWDISPAGDRLKSPRGITADENAQKIFLRSAYPCGSCSVTQSSVFSVTDSGEVADRCL